MAPSAADKTGNVVTFNFKTPVCSGSSPGHGQTTYFFSLASSQPAHAVTATVLSTLGGSLSLNARAPLIRRVHASGGLPSAAKPPGR